MPSVSVAAAAAHAANSTGGGSNRARKSTAKLVEKIGKTLDKISSSSPSSQGKQQQQQQEQQQQQHKQDVYANFPPWLYPSAAAAAAHAQSRLAAPTSAGAFYPNYDFGGEVVGGRVVVGGRPGGRVQQHPPCTCHDRLYGSVRSGFKPCKSCRSLQLRSQYRDDETENSVQLRIVASHYGSMVNIQF